MPEWRRFVRAFDVCWESGPSLVQHDGRRVGVGYEITLTARHPDGLAADLDSHTSRSLRRELTGLALAVCPPAADGLVCAPRREPARLVLRRDSGWRPELEQHIDVLRREDTFDEAGEAARRCRSAIEQRLLALGVPPADARPSASAAPRVR